MKTALLAAMFVAILAINIYVWTQPASQEEPSVMVKTIYIQDTTLHRSIDSLASAVREVNDELKRHHKVEEDQQDWRNRNYYLMY